MTAMKTCTNCKAEKPLSGFHKDARRPDGRRSHCSVCSKAYTRGYYKSNREKVIAANRAYSLARPEIRWVASYRERTKAYGLDPVVVDFTLADVIAAHGGECAHCGGRFEELDHYPTPVATGGAHTINNVRPSCVPCNRAQSWDARAARKIIQQST